MAAEPLTLTPARAIVCAGAHETEYLRAGRGCAVLYLGGAPDADPARAALFAALATRFRVIAPKPPPRAATAPSETSEDAFVRWLDGVCDGLGIECASLVVEAPLAAEAARFADAYPGRVDRLVVLPDGAGAYDVLGLLG